MRALALLLLWLATGCARWQQIPIRRLEQATLSGRRVRLTMLSGEQLTIAPRDYRPLALVGTRDGPDGTQQVRVDLRHVMRAEQSDYNRTGTWIAVGLVVAVAAMAAFAVVGAIGTSNADMGISLR